MVVTTKIAHWFKDSSLRSLYSAAAVSAASGLDTLLRTGGKVTPSELATLLGVSLSTVYRHLSRSGAVRERASSEVLAKLKAECRVGLLVRLVNLVSAAAAVAAAESVGKPHVKEAVSLMKVAASNRQMEAKLAVEAYRDPDGEMDVAAFSRDTAVLVDSMREGITSTYLSANAHTEGGKTTTSEVSSDKDNVLAFKPRSARA